MTKPDKIGSTPRSPWLLAVVSGIAATLLSTFVLWVAGAFTAKLSDSQAEASTRTLANDSSFIDAITIKLQKAGELKKLVGPQGPKGDQGPPGIPGGRGEKGAKGARGADGIGLPIGTVAVWPGRLPGQEDQTWHDQWRVCDGAEFAAGELDDLVRAFGGASEWPYGGAAGRFRLPDFRGRFLRGVGSFGAKPLGQAQGWSPGAHTHIVPTTYRGTDHGDQISSSHSKGQAANRDFSTGVVAGPSGADAEFADESRPVNYSVHWIIRVR
ncbi:Phage Tail Collar Domain protein [Planctomycetes bacterium Poly30]|uniref:Phage Tail Collar Domain protein n=1 Tax=Saltatorellus ferox TaxID=2528018 RepID=A0A518EZ04_9BACT|nr:Phage Tail Collar Domain protein [Planctomycetes bacterium Poly30]